MDPGDGGPQALSWLCMEGVRNEDDWAPAPIEGIAARESANFAAAAGGIRPDARPGILVQEPSVLLGGLDDVA